MMDGGKTMVRKILLFTIFMVLCITEVGICYDYQNVYGGSVRSAASSTNNGVVCWDGTFGRYVKDCSGTVGVDASGNFSVTALRVTGLPASSPVFTDSASQLTGTGIVPLSKGGTGSGTMVGAQQNLGLTYVVVDSSATVTLPSAVVGLKQVYSNRGVSLTVTIAPASGEQIEKDRILGGVDKTLVGDGLAYTTIFCECWETGIFSCYDNEGVSTLTP
jgi:hypothetical protein